CDRKAHRDAWAESMTIFETQNDKAQQEIEALVKEVIL
ncbi:cobyrinic acid ac-diamide synthase, partial [Escherichia coli]